jgi:hypothetical protein
MNYSKSEPGYSIPDKYIKKAKTITFYDENKTILHLQTFILKGPPISTIDANREEILESIHKLTTLQREMTVQLKESKDIETALILNRAIKLELELCIAKEHIKLLRLKI